MVELFDGEVANNSFDWHYVSTSATEYSLHPSDTIMLCFKISEPSKNMHEIFVRNFLCFQEIPSNSSAIIEKYECDCNFGNEVLNLGSIRSLFS